MKEMHAKGIHHSDLKPSNLLVTSSLEILISGFRACKKDSSTIDSDNTGLSNEFPFDEATRAG
jgi:serine/threonine protein kinase